MKYATVVQLLLIISSTLFCLSTEVLDVSVTPTGKEYPLTKTTLVNNIEELCIVFDISLTNCSCSMFKINFTDNFSADFCEMKQSSSVFTTLLPTTTTTTTHSKVNTESGTIVNTMDDLCRLFEIPLSKCSCELFTFNNTSFPDICGFLKDLLKGERNVGSKEQPSKEITSFNLIAEHPSVEKGTGIMINTIEDLCQIFRVPSFNCSCKIFNFDSNIDAFQDICHQEKKLKNKKILLVHNSKITRSKLDLHEIYNSDPSSQRGRKEKGGMVVGKIEDLCKVFGLPLSNCSCKMFVYNETDVKSSNLCNFTEEYWEKNKTVLIYSATFSRTYASVNVIASVIGLIGNIAVVIVSYRNRKSQPRFKTLMAQLAVSDSFFAITQMVLVVPRFWTNKWLYGNFMCKTLRSSVTLGGLASISLLLVISLERYLGIVYPLRKSLSGIITNFLSAALVFVSVISVIPLFIVIDIDPLGRCTELWPNKIEDSTKFNWFLMIFYFLIPICVITYFCFQIIRYLRAQSDGNLVVLQNGKQRRTNENQRVMLILVAMLVAYIVCIFPNRIIWVYFDAVNWKVGKDLYKFLTYSATFTFPLHVAVNPIIYIMIDKEWHRDILSVLTLKFLKLSSSTAAPSSSQGKDEDLKNPQNHGSIFINQAAYFKDATVKDNFYLLTPEKRLVKSDLTKPVNDNVFKK